jgi:hypothetical protein
MGNEDVLALVRRCKIQEGEELVRDEEEALIKFDSSIELNAQCKIIEFGLRYCDFFMKILCTGFSYNPIETIK